MPVELLEEVGAESCVEVFWVVIGLCWVPVFCFTSHFCDDWLSYYWVLINDFGWDHLFFVVLHGSVWLLYVGGWNELVGD